MPRQLMFNLPVLAAVLLGAFFVSVPQARAATLYYDGGIVDIAGNGNSAASGLTGNWNTALMNWDAGPVAYVGWNNANNDIAFFHMGTPVPGPVPGTVSLTSDITVGGIVYNATGYTISTGVNALTFGGANNTVALNNSVSAATINGTLGTSSANMTFAAQNPLSNHTLTFSGASANAWSGTTTVNAGLTLTSTSASGVKNFVLGSTSGITLNGGAITVNRHYNAAGENYINDGAPISVNGGGTLNISSLTAGNSALNETIHSVTVNSGQFFLSPGNGSSGSHVTVANGITRNGTSAIGFFSNTGVSGNNTVTVAGAGTTAGWVNAASTNPIFSPAVTLGTAVGAQNDYVVFNANVVTAANTAASAENTWTDASKQYTSSAAAVALSGNRTMDALRNTGATATITLSDGVSGFTLATRGILNGVATALIIAPGAVPGSLTVPGASGGNLYLNTGSAGITVSAPIIDNGGNVTVVKSGSTNVVLSGNNTYTGGTVVNAGNVTLSGSNTFATGAAGADIINGGSLTYSTIASWGGAGRDVTFNGTGTLTSTVGGYVGGTLTSNAGANAVIAAAGSGAPSISFATTTGAGNVIYSTGANRSINLGDASGLTGNLQARLTGNANFNANTTIQFSSLSDAVGSALQFVGGTSDSNQAMTVAFVGSAPLVFNNRQVQILDRLTSNWEVRDNVIANNSAVAANTWTINTDLLYTGGRAITAFGGSLQTGRRFVLSGSNTGDNVFNGVISDGQNTNGLILQKAGTGAWALGGNNTHSGGTLLSTGTLNINNAGALGTGTFTLSGGTIDNTSGGAITNTNNNVQAYNANFTFTGSNDLDMGTGNFTYNATRQITVTANKLTLGGNNVSGAFGTTKLGNGTLALTGAASTNTGVNTISAGVLEVAVMSDGGTASSLGSQTNAASNLLLGNGTTLRYVGSANSTTDRSFTINGTAAGHGATIESSGMGTLSFSGSPALAYGTNNQTRTLTLGGSNTGDNTFDTTLSDNGAGATSLVKNGAGKWILTGTSGYSGNTTVSDGTLIVNGTLSSALNDVIIASGATLGGTGIISGSVDIQTGGFLAPGNSIGTMNVGPLTISGTESMELGLPGTVPSPGLSDRTNVTGALTLNAGSTLNLIDNGGNGGNGFLGAGRYQLMTYTGALSGTFTNVTGLPSTHLADVIYNAAGMGVSDGVLLDLFDHGQASLSGGGVVMNTATDFTLDFGMVDQNSAQTAALLLENLINTLGFTAGIDLDSLAETGDDAALATGTFTNDLGSPIANLGAGANSAFNIGFDTSTLGVFTADYVFTLSDVNGLLGSGSLPTLTLHVLGEVQAVPEPAAVAVWSIIGLCLAGVGVRRYRRKK